MRARAVGLGIGVALAVLAAGAGLALWSGLAPWPWGAAGGPEFRGTERPMAIPRYYWPGEYWVEIADRKGRFFYLYDLVLDRADLVAVLSGDQRPTP